jgi:hypothetical protein
MDDIWVFAYEVQQLLQIDAGDGGGKVYPGTLQAAIDGVAGGHLVSVALHGKKTFCKAIDVMDLRVTENQGGDCFRTFFLDYH